MVAAGRGRRMGGELKQLRPLAGRPTLCWSTRPLLDALSGPVIVVLPAEAIEVGEALLRERLGSGGERVRVVAGGERRQDSVRAGLDALAGVETVLVHDGVRPFASVALVERVARHAAAGRAVVPATLLPDTLKEVDGERVVRTHDRRRFVAAQTPQGFPLSTLREAHAAAATLEATDDAHLCEEHGVPVVWLPGEPLNRKLTEPEDWAWAETALAAGHVRWPVR